MEIQEKILSNIELDAKIKGMESKATQLVISINAMEMDIVAQRKVKADLEAEKESASDILEDSGDRVATIESRITGLKKELKAVIAEEKQAQETFASFTEEVMAEPDNKVISLNKEMGELHTEREALAKEILAEKTNLNNLQEELKKAGYELNISSKDVQTNIYL